MLRCALGIIVNISYSNQFLKLVQLKELKVITEEEFQVEKRKVLKNS